MIHEIAVQLLSESLTGKIITAGKMNIEKKIALVTGGANGIGFAYVTELLRNGAAHVAVLDLTNSKGEEAVSKLNREFGQGRAIFVICDVAKPKELEDGFAKTVNEFGGLDIVINNAGIMDDSRWELMININYNAIVRGTLLGLQYMGKDKGGKGGTIVNVASVVGIRPSLIFPIYAGTKHAIIGFSRSFGLPFHYEKTGVRLLTMCPSITDTQLVSKSAGRSLDYVKPEDITKALNLYPSQTVDSVAQGMMHIIRVGETGSVWFIEGDEPIFEVEVPDAPIRKGAVKGQH